MELESAASKTLVNESRPESFSALYACFEPEGKVEDDNVDELLTAIALKHVDQLFETIELEEWAKMNAGNAWKIAVKYNQSEKELKRRNEGLQSHLHSCQQKIVELEKQLAERDRAVGQWVPSQQYNQIPQPFIQLPEPRKRQRLQ